MTCLKIQSSQEAFLDTCRLLGNNLSMVGIMVLGDEGLPMCNLNLGEISYSHASFWFAIALINIFISYRYYSLAKKEDIIYGQIKKAFGKESLYICKGDFVVLENESEAESCVDLGNFMLSSSKTSQRAHPAASCGACSRRL
jgi:hypothetical protein